LKRALSFLTTHIAYVVILTNYFHNTFGDFHVSVKFIRLKISACLFRMT